MINESNPPHNRTTHPHAGDAQAIPGISASIVGFPRNDRSVLLQADKSSLELSSPHTGRKIQRTTTIGKMNSRSFQCRCRSGSGCSWFWTCSCSFFLLVLGDFFVEGLAGVISFWNADVLCQITKGRMIPNTATPTCTPPKCSDRLKESS